MNLKSLFDKAFEEYGITEEEIKSKSRKSPIITVKNILICYLINKKVYDIEKVAEEFNIHRTSIYHVLKQSDNYECEFKLFEGVVITDYNYDQDIIKKALNSKPSQKLKEYLLNFKL